MFSRKTAARKNKISTLMSKQNFGVEVRVGNFLFCGFVRLSWQDCPESSRSFQPLFWLSNFYFKGVFAFLRKPCDRRKDFVIQANNFVFGAEQEGREMSSKMFELILNVM